MALMIAAALSQQNLPVVGYILGHSPDATADQVQESVYELIENGLDYFVARNKLSTAWYLAIHGIFLDEASDILGYNKYSLDIVGDAKTINIREDPQLPAPKQIKWLLTDVICEYSYPRLFIIYRYINPDKVIVNPGSNTIQTFRRVGKDVYEVILHIPNGPNVPIIFGKDELPKYIYDIRNIYTKMWNITNGIYTPRPLFSPLYADTDSVFLEIELSN